MPTKLATRPMQAIPLDTAQVTLVDHGAGAGFGLLVDGRPVPNVMLLPAGQVDRYNVIVGGVFYLQVATDEAMRWAPVLARWTETITGTTNGHIAIAANGAPKPAARTRIRRAPAASTATAPKTAAAPRRARAAPRK
jgi:hypothetical protein